MSDSTPPDKGEQAKEQTVGDAVAGDLYDAMKERDRDGRAR
jgi:hypothetical protein